MSGARRRTLWASATAPGPLFHGQCPPFVIAPSARDFQISGRESFLPETQSLDEPARGLIARLNIRLQPMQPQCAESFVKDGLQGLRHQAATVVWDEGVVTEIGRQETAPDDLADVNDTRK